MPTVPLYDDLSADYDRFVDWEARLRFELPFIEEQLRAADARSVLDAACGTGMHAVALAERGYAVAGADLSAPMIERARLNAGRAHVSVRFEVAGFGDLSARVGHGFASVLCLGNSLPHALEPADLTSTLLDFAAALRPGGLLLMQNRNFHAVLAGRQRWQEPQSHREGEQEWLFLRFYDFLDDGSLLFHVWTLQRKGAGPWSQSVTSTPMRPWRHAELLAALDSAGFRAVQAFGDMQGHPFHPERSPNLVLTARTQAP